MTALSADKNLERYEGDVWSFTVKTGETIYKGAMVAIDATGYALPAGNDAAHIFVGVAMEQAAEGETIRVYRKGIFNFAAAGMAVTDTGSRVYVSDDATVTTTVGNGVYVGKIVRVDSATSVWVDLAPGAPVLGTVYDRSILAIPVKLSKVADGDILSGYVPGFAGSIAKLSAVVTDPVTTADKGTTINLEIGTTDLTGGVLTLTSANLATLGAVVNATAITANNAFTDSGAISIEAASTTAFVEGEIVLLIVLKHATAAS